MGVIKINGVTYGGDNSVMLTQAEYDALVEAGTVDPTVLYMITDRNLGSTPYAAGVIYDNTDSGLDATNVQNAIDEIVEDGIPADTIPYDNTTSGLTATDMQSAIDEVVGDIDTLTASQIGYSNTTSGLTATDVQAAVDELAPVKTSIGNITDVDLTSVQAGDLMQWQNINGVLKLVPANVAGDIVKAKEVNISNSNLSNGIAMSQFLSIDSGYKFLCWIMISSVGWVMNRPMYFENPTYDNTKIWWAADMTLPANTNCRFSYLEIKDV